MFRVSAILFTLSLCLGFGIINASCENEHEEKVYLETIYLEQLESYIRQVEKRQANIKRFLNYVDVVHNNIEDPQEYFGNPLNAFTTISRFVNNWKREIIDVILGNAELDQHHYQINNRIKEYELEEPTGEDLLDVTSLVLSFQDDSEMTTSDLARAVIYTDIEKNKNITLSASDCYVIGRSLHKIQLYDSSAEWLMEAQSLLSHNYPTFSSVEKVKVLEELAPVLQQLGSYKLANKVNNDILKADPEHEAALKNKIILEDQLALERLSNKNLKDEL